MRWIAVDQPRYRQLQQAGLFSWSASERAAFESLLGGGAPEVAHFGDEHVYRLR